MKMQFVPASHGQNTLGTDVPRIIRHDGAKNRVGRVPGTRTGAADLDYEGNVYTEKRVMWETLSPEVGMREDVAIVIWSSIGDGADNCFDDRYFRAC